MPYIGNTAADRFVASKAASVFSGDGSTTAFTLDHSVGSDEDILVSVDGVIQEPSVAYSVSGTTLTFTAAPSSNAGNNIFVYYLFRTVGTVSHPSSNALEATSGTFTGEIKTDTINNASGDNDSGIDLSTNDVVAVKIAGSEKARVDSSGNLLVGATSTATSDYGAKFLKDSSSTILAVHRQANDGDLIQFARGGNTVGTITTYSGDLVIGTGDTGLFFNDTSDHIKPVTTVSDSNRDDAIDLGSAGSRFDNIRASNGSIVTSDRNEKNTITDSDLGIDFIKRLEPKSYIFNGKTRTHYGLIAQDVETVLSDINKPTSGFAGFCKDDISEEQDGSEYRYGLRYHEFVAPLIQAVKDQQAVIEDLQARITALENS